MDRIVDQLPALVQRAQAGNLDAFGRLVLRFQNMAHAYAYAVLGDAHLAEDAAQHERGLAAGLTIAKHFRDQGEDVLLLVHRQIVQHQLDQRRAGVGTTATGAITAILFDLVQDDAFKDAADDVDSRLVFSAGLAKQTLYPAVNPVRFTSRLLDVEHVGAEHVAVAQQARDLLTRYTDLHEAVTAHGLDALNAADRTVAVRARRIQRFFTQPFAVAEPWTGQPGEQVALADTIAGVQTILAGRYDHVPEDALRFVGRLPNMSG